MSNLTFPIRMYFLLECLRLNLFLRVALRTNVKKIQTLISKMYHSMIYDIFINFKNLIIGKMAAPNSPSKYIDCKYF